MKTDKEIDDLIGKANFWNPIRTVNLFHYVGGVEEFDEHIDPNSYWKAPNIADIEVRPNGLVLKMMHKFKIYKVAIKNNDLLTITLEDKEQIKVNKERSVVGRAVLGGILFGPVGAIVGGMTGLKQTIISAEMPDLLLTFSLGSNIENMEKAIIFSCKYKDKVKAYEFLSKNMPSKFKF